MGSEQNVRSVEGHKAMECENDEREERTILVGMHIKRKTSEGKGKTALFCIFCQGEQNLKKKERLGFACTVLTP